MQILEIQMKIPQKKKVKRKRLNIPKKEGMIIVSWELEGCDHSYWGRRRVWLLFLRNQKGVVIVYREEGGCGHIFRGSRRVWSQFLGKKEGVVIVFDEE